MIDTPLGKSTHNLSRLQQIPLNDLGWNIS